MIKPKYRGPAFQKPNPCVAPVVISPVELVPYTVNSYSGGSCELPDAHTKRLEHQVTQLEDRVNKLDDLTGHLNDYIKRLEYQLSSIKLPAQLDEQLQTLKKFQSRLEWLVRQMGDDQLQTDCKELITVLESIDKTEEIEAVKIDADKVGENIVPMKVIDEVFQSPSANISIRFVPGSTG